MKIAISKGDGGWHRDGGWHLFTNEWLAVGDEVFPLVDSYHSDGQLFITGMIDTTDDASDILACTGWPSNPHTIQEFYQQEGLQWARTDKGYSPAAVYFKLLTPEENKKESN